MSEQVNWFELPVDDTEKARAFYAGLFGWETSQMGEDYHFITNGAAGAIAGLGGKSDDVRSVPDVSRIAHCADDQGTPFSLYEPQS